MGGGKCGGKRRGEVERSDRRDRRKKEGRREDWKEGRMKRQVGEEGRLTKE